MPRLAPQRQSMLLQLALFVAGTGALILWAPPLLLEIYGWLFMFVGLLFVCEYYVAGRR